MRTFNRSSWFPLRNFTKTGCHFDWMMGATRFFGVKDFLFPSKTLVKNETVFWNRTLNANIALSSYQEVQRSGDPDLVRKCEEIGLPMDVRV